MDGATVNGQQIKVNEVSVFFRVAPLPQHLFFLCFRLAHVVMGAAVAVEDMEVVVATVVAAVVADTEVC